MLIHSWEQSDLDRYKEGGAKVIVLSRKYNPAYVNTCCPYYVIGDVNLYDFILLINPFTLVSKGIYKKLSLQDFVTDRLYMDKSLDTYLDKDDCIKFALHTITLLQTYSDLSRLCVRVSIDVLFSLESIATLYFQKHRYKSQGVKPIINSYKDIPPELLPELRQVRWRIISIAETVLSKLQQIKEYTKK